MAGDSRTWHDDPVTDNNGRVLTSGSYTLTYYIAGLGLATPLALTAASDGPGWKTTITTAQSAVLPFGNYSWKASVAGSGERITVGEGELIIEQDFSTAANYDGRSVAEKALADAEAALATFRSTHGRTKKYTIGMRTMEFDTAGDILTEISFWRMRVANENAGNQIAQGLGNPRKMFVRFK